MHVTIEFSKSLSNTAKDIVIPTFVEDGKILPQPYDLLSDGVKDYLTGVLNNETLSFSGGYKETATTYAPDGEALIRIVFYGLGDKADWDVKRAEEAGGHLFTALKSQKAQSFQLLGCGLGYADRLLFGLSLRSYNFEKYKEAKSNDQRLSAITYVGFDALAVQQSFDDLQPVQQGVFLARDLVNEAPNTLYPESYAELIKEELKPLGVEVEVLDEKKMLKLGMGGIMAVGQGSARQPRMVIMRWNGGAKDDRPVALVGKGVTFDTGGISLKPGAGMDEMKMDMGGSAAVVGAMKAIAGRKAQSNVVGIVGLAENMPSSNAYRPGDIITTYAGKTIEVLNTDAEGRLVLADALTYVQKEYDPQAVIDLATLTGAMMVALGHEYCGTFANDDALWDQLDAAGKAGHEKLWRMPLDETWLKEVESTVADLRNLGKTRFAGACTAAAFLQHFVDEDRQWAHMDIAGTAWIKADRPTVPKFGVGFGVRTLDQWVQQFHEADDA